MSIDDEYRAHGAALNREMDRLAKEFSDSLAREAAIRDKYAARRRARQAQSNEIDRWVGWAAVPFGIGLGAPFLMGLAVYAWKSIFG